MFKKTVLLLAAAVAMTPSVMAGNYPTQPFDATYIVSSVTGKADMRMASDGKGHLYTETAAAGQKYGTIVDYIAGTSTSLIPQGKMAMKSKLPPEGGYVADEASVKKMGGKSLGAKTINGHPCHGYEYSQPGAKTQAWVGDDCKIVVQSTTDTAAGKTVMEMKTFAGKAAAELFQIPTGYKEMSQ